MQKFHMKSFPFIGEAIDLLQKLKGQRILEFVRVPRQPPDEYIGGFHKIRADQVFEYCNGPAFLSVESGLCVGFRDWEKERSVCAWEENFPLTHEEALKKCNYGMGEAFIDCRDARYSNSYWSNLIGRRIERLAILKVANDPTSRNFRNERGLLFVTEGQEWLMSSNLSESGPAGFLLIPKEDIGKEFVNKFMLTDI